MLLTSSVFLVVLLLLRRKTKKKIFEAFQNSTLKRQRVKTGTYRKLQHTNQWPVLFINLLRPSITTILQHRTFETLEVKVNDIFLEF